MFSFLRSADCVPPCEMSLPKTLLLLPDSFLFDITKLGRFGMKESIKRQNRVSVQIDGANKHNSPILFVLLKTEHFSFSLFCLGETGIIWIHKTLTFQYNACYTQKLHEGSLVKRVLIS